MTEKLRSFFFPAMGASPLNLARVVLGLALALEWYSLGGHLNDLYGPSGFLQANLMNFVDGWSLPLISPLLEKWGMAYERALQVLSHLRWAAIVLFTAGLWVRPSAFVLWLTQALLMQSGSHSNYGVDRYFLVLLFIFLFLPTRNSFLFRRNRLTIPSSDFGFAFRYLQLTILIIYVDAGISKAFGNDWWSGDAVWRAVHLPEFYQMNLEWLADHPIVPKLLGWGTMFLETFYIAGVWIPVIGPLWVLAVIGMHLGIVFFLGLTTFGLTLAGLNFALFLYPWYEKYKARKIGY